MVTSRPGRSAFRNTLSFVLLHGVGRDGGEGGEGISDLHHSCIVRAKSGSVPDPNTGVIGETKWCQIKSILNKY